ncbi:MAG: radical SAM protein [Desulfobacteraceae bacterium]|nr:radical SAM protein [Desulfobacteraceae bacterium]
MRIYFIDIVDSCNLRCPTCVHSRRSKKNMELEFFKEILNKIKKKDKNVTIALYCAGEPLLHPELPSFVEAVKETGFYCDLSTNLSIQNIENLLQMPPHRLVISTSGYFQDVYSKGHRGGYANLVISNLYKLRHAMDKSQYDFEVKIVYYVYRHNTGQDIQRIANIADALRFEFCAELPHMQGTDIMLEYLYLCRNSLPLTDQFRQAESILLVTHEDMSRIGKLHQELNPAECWFFNNMVYIRPDGSVGDCLSVYDAAYTRAGNFLDMDYSELERPPYSKICRQCSDEGIHSAIYWGHEDLRKLANERLLAQGSEFRLGENIRYQFPYNDKNDDSLLLL